MNGRDLTIIANARRERDSVLAGYFGNSATPVASATKAIIAANSRDSKTLDATSARIVVVASAAQHEAEAIANHSLTIARTMLLIALAVAIALTVAIGVAFARRLARRLSAVTVALDGIVCEDFSALEAACRRVYPLQCGSPPRASNRCIPLATTPILPSLLRIAVLGAGKIGSTFAFQFARVGHHDVTVIARPGSLRPQQLQRDHAVIDVKGERAQVHVIDKLDEQPPYDFLIVTLLDHQTMAMLPTLQRCAAKCIEFMFSTVHPERLRDAIGPARSAFGMPFVQATLDSDGRLKAARRPPWLAPTPSRA